MRVKIVLHNGETKWLNEVSEVNQNEYTTCVYFEGKMRLYMQAMGFDTKHIMSMEVTNEDKNHE